MNASERLMHNRGPEPALSMKWHQFLIYFSLWLSALSTLINAGTYFIGLTYGADAPYVYAAYAGLSLLDKAMGACCVVLAVFAVVTRFSLAKRKANGPKRLITFLAATLALNVLYLVGFSVVTGISFIELLDPPTISSLAVSVVMIFVNKSYYSNRADLFIN